MRREREPELARRVGSRIRRERLGRGLTLKQIEARAGLSLTFVSEVERGRTTPTVGSLAKIARALQVSAAELLAGPEPARTLVAGAAADRRLLTLHHGAAVVECLLGPDSPYDVSLYLLRLAPNAALAEHECAMGVAEEFGQVLDGQLVVRVGDLEYALNEGDAIHFRGDLGHTLTNPRSTPARAFWVTYPRARW